MAGLFGGSEAIQQILLWSVVGQLIGPILAPVVQELGNVSNQGAISSGLEGIPLSPAELALGVVKNTLGGMDPHTEARKSQVPDGDFDVMVLNTGEPISITEALFLLRRGKIDAAQFEHAVRQSRVRDEWIPQLLQLNQQPISAADAIAAYVSSQIDEATARQYVKENGLEDAAFDVLYHTRGRPPGPAELLEMVRRGIIPAHGAGPEATTLEQGVRESDIKNKWLPIYDALLEYLPPPRTVTALLRAGSITQPQALDLFRKAGLSPELAAAYVADASHAKLATQKELTQATITQLYTEKLIDATQATAMLEHLHFTAEEAAFLLKLGDLQHHQRIYTAAVNRVGTLFTARKIEQAQAATLLDQLQVPAATRDEYLTVWALERASNLKILSEATIATAWKYGAITDSDALAEVEAHGYTPHDAWIFLAAHNKGAGPGPEPPRDAIHGLL
jgi:hypothetical protein